MRHYKLEEVLHQKLSAVECDVCKRVFDPSLDSMEIQEITEIHFIGGYSSIFGDGSEVSCDICQGCLKSLLGPYLRLR